jgi:hypothetical protein
MKAKRSLPRGEDGVLAKKLFSREVGFFLVREFLFILQLAF